MNLLTSKYGTKITSLGYNCFPISFIRSIDSRETMFFDFVGSSMKGIVECIDNNFRNCFEITPIRQNDKYVMFNLNYFISFYHDLKQMNTEEIPNINIELFNEKKQRQIVRFKESLSKSGIFVRYEASEFFSGQDDLHWLKEFSLRVKKKRFIILFFSERLETEYIEEFKIFIIKIDKSEFTFENSPQKFREYIDRNEEFIRSIV